MNPANELPLLQHLLLVGGGLFCLGLIGFIVRRNMIVMFLCAEMMLQGVSLSLIGWSRYHADLGGQALMIFIIVVAACEAGIALALVLMLARRTGQLDIVIWQEMREDDRPPYVDQEIPDEREEDRQWPSLTPAGVEPERRPEDEMYRPRI